MLWSQNERKGPRRLAVRPQACSEPLQGSSGCWIDVQGSWDPGIFEQKKPGEQLWDFGGAFWDFWGGRMPCGSVRESRWRRKRSAFFGLRGHCLRLMGLLMFQKLQQFKAFLLGFQLFRTSALAGRKDSIPILRGELHHSAQRVEHPCGIAPTLVDCSWT